MALAPYCPLEGSVPGLCELRLISFCMKDNAAVQGDGLEDPGAGCPALLFQGSANFLAISFLGLQ